MCQLCYGRSLAANDLVAIGEAVGHIAAQSIGEPGTQLTMRTFHTGGVAGADITHGLPRVVELFEARKPKGQAKITQFAGTVKIEESDKAKKVLIIDDETGEELHSYAISRRVDLMVEDGQHVEAGDQLYEGSLNPHELLKYRGALETARYIVGEVQEVYHKQGVQIDDKHVELIVRQMTKKVLVETSGDTSFLPGRMVDRLIFDHENDRVVADGGEPATCEEIILGITKASLATESFLSAASFQETTKVLTDAALEGKVDELRGLKENVIIGKLIPAATGLRSYRNIELATAGIPAEMDVFGDMMTSRMDSRRSLARAAVGAAHRYVPECRGVQHAGGRSRSAHLRALGAQQGWSRAGERSAGSDHQAAHGCPGPGAEEPGGDPCQTGREGLDPGRRSRR